MEPVAALRRIAYLLERDGAESYKVRAFRTAASAIADLPVDELALTSAGLQKIPGVGKTSAQVILEAVGGATPAYLEKLESAEPPAMSAWRRRTVRPPPGRLPQPLGLVGRGLAHP